MTEPARWRERMAEPTVSGSPDPAAAAQFARPDELVHRRHRAYRRGLRRHRRRRHLHLGLLRYFFSVQIPDAYDFGRLLLGILIFWGIAATSYRGTHITVDLLYANVGPRLQRFIDVFATLVLLFVVTVQTYTLYDKVWTTRADHVLTFDLRLPVWPFFLVAWLGDISAVLLIAMRTYRLIFQPSEFGGAVSDQAGRVRRDEQRRDRGPGFCRAVRADAPARAGRHGDGARRRDRLCLSGQRRCGAEDHRSHLDAHGDRLHLRRHPDVPVDGRVRLQFRA